MNIDKTERVRVLLVAPSLRFLGGQAVQASNLLNRMRQDGSVHVDILHVDPVLPGLLGNLQRVKYIRTVLTTAWYIATLLARIPAYDVIHIFSAAYWSFLLAPTPALIVTRLYRRKSILNYRAGQAEDHLRRWHRTAIRTIRLADRVVVPSGYLVDVFSRFGLKAEAIHNFVDIDRFRFRRRNPLRPVFLSNRNLEPLYQVDCILRAFARIQRGYPEARLVVAGDGSQRNSLETLAGELGLRNVEFRGRIPHPEMHRLYDEADIYLNSPHTDNMPGSIIEAYASGLAVASTDAGGISYIVKSGETGLLVPVGEPEALAEAALRYLHDEEFAARIAARARQECEQYTWPAVRMRWLEIYRELSGGATTKATASSGRG